MGKQDYINIAKRVLHNLTINSTLPNTKNYFSAIRWVYCIVGGAKREWTAHHVTQGIGKHP